MDLAAAFEIAKARYEEILDTSGITYDWYSVLYGFDFGETTQAAYTQHCVWPTTRSIISPTQDSDSWIIPLRFHMDYTHIGSTKLRYLEDPDLVPDEADEDIIIDGIVYSKPAHNDWRMKRGDKLIEVDTGVTYHVVNAHRSTMGTHTLLGLMHEHYMKRSA